MQQEPARRRKPNVARPSNGTGAQSASSSWMSALLLDHSGSLRLAVGMATLENRTVGPDCEALVGSDTREISRD